MISRFEIFVGLRYSFGHKRDRLSRFISSLSGVGLVLGVAMMITVLSVMNGFDREMREKILVVVPHIKLFTGEQIQDWPSVAERVADNPKVLSVHPYSELEVLLRVRSEVEPMLIYALDPEAETQAGRFGELLGEEALRLITGDDRGILLGQGLVSRFDLEVGETLNIFLFDGSGSAIETARFRLAGVLHTGTEADQRLGIVDLDSLSAFSSQSSMPTGLRVQTSDLFGTRSLAYDLLNKAGFNYRATTWAMTHGNLYELIQMSRNLVGLIVLLILAIAAFNLISTLMISSADKQSELAVLKTIGAAPSRLSAIFAIQGLVVGVIGSAVGALLGVLLSTQVINFTGLIEFFTGEDLLQSSVYPLDYLPSHLSLTQVVVVVLVAVLLSVVASVYPAWKVSKIDPAQVLRYE